MTMFYTIHEYFQISIELWILFKKSFLYTKLVFYLLISQQLFSASWGTEYTLFYTASPSTY
jgi:hypothetical protein